MLHLLFAATTLLGSSAPVPAPARAQEERPDPKVVERALEELKDGLRESEPEKRAQAIVQNSEVADARVVAMIARALRDRSDEVKGAAIGALRYNAHPSALDALHKAYKSERKLRKQPELYANLLRAIGQHQDESSIPYLSDGSLSGTHGAVATARIYGLGNIRHAKSAEALIQLMRSADRKEMQTLMGQARLSLMLLTGVDMGASQDRWMAWWNDNKKDFEVASKAPRLPGDLQRRWEGYWGLDRTYDRPTRRNDRGKDPEKGGGR